MFKSTIAKRVFFGTLLILIFTAYFLFEGWLSCRNYFLSHGNFQGLGFALLAVLFIGLGSVELNQIARTKNIQFPTKLLFFIIALILLQPFWAAVISDKCDIPSSIFFALAVVLCLFFAAFAKALQSGTENTLINLGFVCFTVVYLGLCGWFIVQLRLIGSSSESAWGQIRAVIVFVACVKSCDIGAYFTGRFLGRHKWVPSISPKKTWEGLWGGIVLATIVASLFAHFSGIMGIGRAVVFGVVVAITGQLGDLLESMLKRDAGSKDSAALIPEFGGALDLLDSVLGAAPFAYLVLAWY
jgi:phosphatidate cytidylyltransferase